jgi:O-antigen/teichoic acid export membrane protein
LIKLFKDRFLINTGSNAFSRLFNQVVNFILYPYIILNIGVEAVGIMAIMESVVGPVSFFQSSFIPSKIKYLSEYSSKKIWIQFNNVVNCSLLITFIISLAISIILLLISVFFENIFSISQNSIILASQAAIITAFTVLFSYSLSIGEEIFMSIQRYDVYNGVIILFSTIKLLIIIYFLNVGLTLNILLIINGLSIIGRRLLLIIIAKKYVPDLIFNVKYINTKTLSELFIFSGKILIIALSTFVTRHMGQLITGIYISVESAAFYYTCHKIYSFIKSIPLLFQSALLPYISQFEALNEKNKIIIVTKRLTKYIYIAYLIISLPVILTAENLLLLWLGSDFVEYAYILQILLLHPMISLSHSVLSNVVVAKNKFNFGVKYSVMLAIASILLLVFLIKPYQLTGVALSNVLPYFILFSYYLINALKIVGIKPDEFFMETFAPLILPLICFVISSYVYKYYIEIYNFLDIIMFFTFNGTLFLILSYFFSLSSLEKKYFSSLVTSK